MEPIGDLRGRRDTKAESSMTVKRKRSTSDVSVKPDRYREESPLFEPDPTRRDQDPGQNGAHAAQTFRTSDINDGDTQIDTKRTATHSNAVSTQYSLTEVELNEASCVPGYDVMSEERPRLAAFCPNFPMAEQETTRACDSVIDEYAELVRTRGYENEEIAVVCGEDGLQACRVPSIFYPKIGPIAVLGPAGSGKSSAVNSILSQKKAAFENDGDRGTYVPHEYRSAQHDQTSPYRVVATYYPEPEVNKSIVGAFGDIRAMLAEFEEDADDESEDNMLQQRCETALGFFTDLLCFKKHFRNRADTKSYFEDRLDRDHTSADICASLIAWKDEFLESRKSYDPKKAKEIHDVSDENELYALFKRLSRPSKIRGQNQPSPWPILQKIVIHRSVPILDAGVVLADTPGVNDTNLTVVSNTKRYLSNAGTILVFLSYDRIQQNPELNHLLSECIALGKMHRVRLVVTKIDNMKELTDDDKSELGEIEKGVVDAADNAVRLIIANVKETEAAKREAKNRDNDRFAELDDKLTQLLIQKARAIAIQRQVGIEIQCQAIKTVLASRLKELENSNYAPDLRITFISNTQYQLHVAGYKALEQPFLDLQATGVPSLRQELFSVPSCGKLQNLKGLVTNRLPNVLMGVEGILFKSHLERKSDVARTIKAALKKYDQPATEIVPKIFAAFEQLVLQVMKNYLPAWKDDAQKLLSKWKGSVGASTFKAVCQRKGMWVEIKKQKNLQWNSELLKVYKDRVNHGFNKLNNDLETLRKDFAVEIRNTFDQMRITVETSKDAQGKVLFKFFKNVDRIATQVVEKMDGEFDSLKESIDDIRWRMTVASDENYLTHEMTPTWLEAAKLMAADCPPPEAAKKPAGAKGKRAAKPNVHNFRQRIILDKLRGEGGRECVFKKIKEHGHSQLKDVLVTWEKRCNLVSAESSDNVLALFDRCFKDTEEIKSEDPVATAKLKEAVAKALDHHLPLAVQHLDECRAFEQAGSTNKSKC
jgi:hypothetical protein